jgi:DNA-binding phage protein
MAACTVDLSGVEWAARRLRSRLVEIEDCRRALDDEIALVVRAGAAVTHVADAAGLSRQTVYEALARAR